jgi:UDP-galactopyranose mutase
LAVHRYDVAIVGAGFTGATLARCFAEAGRRVLVVDRRPQVGGNAADGYEGHGLLVHLYGPHIFHTNSAEVFAFLSRFTRWRPYVHRVRAYVQGRLVPFPINRQTLVDLYGAEAVAHGVEAFLAARRVPIEVPRNAEEQVMARVGPELYELFFRPYTEKQWGRPARELAPSVTARIPVRLDDDDRYFSDRHQAIPAEGYHTLFHRLLNHPGIHLLLQTPWEEVAEEVPFRRLIYTGPVDAFFDRCHGALPYRSLRFGRALVRREQVLPVATVNWPGHPRRTRVTEMKHLTGQRHPWTILVAEYPSQEGDPYYPILAPDSRDRLARYAEEARRLKTVAFAGRLGRYQYLNMDQAVAGALQLFSKLMANGW